MLGKKQTFKVLYCDICRKHFCSTEKYESEYKGKINDKISSHVKIKNNLLINIVPIFIKKFAFSLGEALFANKTFSTNLSNLGNVEVPKEMAQYILKMDFIMGRSKTKPVGVSCISINNNLRLGVEMLIEDETRAKIKAIIDNNKSIVKNNYKEGNDIIGIYSDYDSIMHRLFSELDGYYLNLMKIKKQQDLIIGDLQKLDELASTEVSSYR